MDQNLFKTYSANLTSYTKLDGSSIMMYPIPKAFTTDGYQVGLNSELSAKDREFIGNMYPLS